MKFLILTALLLPQLAISAPLYMQGKPTIKNGAYQGLKSTEIRFEIDEDVVKICGFNVFSGGGTGAIDRRWTIFGNNLFFGREKVGDYSDGKIYVELKYTAQGEPQKQILVFQWNEIEKTFLYAIKDTYVGGFQSEGALLPAPSDALKKACGE